MQKTTIFTREPNNLETNTTPTRLGYCFFDVIEPREVKSKMAQGYGDSAFYLGYGEVTVTGYGDSAFYLGLVLFFETFPSLTPLPS